MTLYSAGCGSSPVGPTKPPPAAVSETAHYVYHHADDDTVDASWQESYHAWLIQRLGVSAPGKVHYFKYRDRADMGAHTGHYDTNGYAEPGRLEFHTIWPTDNHEVVHVVVMSQIGRSTAFFDEGIAVAFQTNAPAGQLESVFNGQEVHVAARRYLQGGQLVLPLERMLANEDFRKLQDSTLSYREAGSFVRFLIDRYGLDATLSFYRSGGTTGTSSARDVKSAFNRAFGVSLETAEAAWLSMLGTGA